MSTNRYREALPMSALDDIPNPKADASDIVGVVKSHGKIMGYQLSNGRAVSKSDGVALARSGEIRGVGVAHRGDTEYLKSLPDESESNNLSSLPAVSRDQIRG